jgi:glycosyltransferase involved in cell wall biosynthesis
MVYVDGNGPRRLARFIDRELAGRGHRVIRSRRDLTPNQARNRALAEVRTEYVCFVDNDVIVRPGWLEALVRGARETGAWVTGPVILQGEYEDGVIHNAGGEFSFEGAFGSRVAHQRNVYKFQSIEAPREPLVRRTFDYVEFHCVLVRTDAFDKIGPLDEELYSTREHIDLCLRVRDAGGRVCGEPASVVAYLRPPPVELGDLPFFLRRWSEAWNLRSLRHFAAKYGLDPEPYVLRHKAMRRRRRLIYQPLLDGVRRRFGDETATRLGWRLARWELHANRRLVRG